jgi:kumamolisin
MASEKRVPVSGSDRAPLPGARAVGPVDANERVTVTVRIRRSAPLNMEGMLNTASPETLAGRQYMSREEYEEKHGASEEDINKVEEFAHDHNLTVVETSSGRRSVILSGTAADMSVAFGVKLECYEHPGGTYRGRIGAVHIPDDLAGIIEGVFGLDDRPQARPQVRRSPSLAAMTTSFTPPDLAKLYNFPAGANGKGQCIAIIELNTQESDNSPMGTGYRTTDLKHYFKQLGIKSPSISAVSVDGGHNLPMLNPNADGEVDLDIEVAGAIAPGAKIAVYFAPNTDQGFLDAITRAIHDKKRKPSVISISWGGPEKFWTPQALNSFHQAFQAAAALGVTICAAAGDNGSSDIPPGSQGFDGKAHTDFPASDPFVLACGGTRVIASGGAIQSETVWNDGPDSATGGGVSDAWPLPAYQNGAGVPHSVNPGNRVGRGVPDISGNADPETGYKVLVDGHSGVIGGTSAVAPLWAGLIALLNQNLGKPVGFLNPILYGLNPATGALRDITQGDNGAYVAKTGWDACTGLGSPDGMKLLNALMNPAAPHAVVETRAEAAERVTA